MDLRGNIEDIGALVIFAAAVVTALGLLFTKTRAGLRAVRLKFAEQISDVVFSHPSFLHIDTKVDQLKHEIGKNQEVAEEARQEVRAVKQELTLNGGESIKDKVNATYETVGQLSIRLGNVEQQLETAVVDSADKAKEGGRRKGDPPHGEFGP
jgi:uncharacterized protein YydD (DUF2326 family)